MLKLTPIMYFILVILSFTFLLVIVVIDSLVFGRDPWASVSMGLPLGAAFLAQIKGKEE